MTWHGEAACLGADPETFFPERGDTAGVAAALAVCAECPVVDSCLAEGLEQKDGILGGTTAAQRRRLRAERGTARACAWCGTTFTARYVNTVACSDQCKKDRRSAMQAESNLRNKKVWA